MTSASKQVLIIGGGAAGIAVASSLQKRADKGAINITIVDPADKHYYQPAFTLVGAGAYPLEKTTRNEKDLIPEGVTWLQASATAFDPDNNQVTLSNGDNINYDFLVVCPGLELNWEPIAGAKEAIGQDGVCSNYSADYVQYTWECLQQVKAGDKLLFTQPPMPFKCPGAPQKIAYLAADYLKKKGLLDQCELHFLNHGPAMFGVPYFAKELVKVAERYGINVHLQSNLTSIDRDAKKATFEKVGSDGETFELEFDMIHVTPAQRPPQVIRDSALADQAGYVEVDHNSLQHVRFANVFGFGDACSTPNSKTAAAIRKQSPIVVRNILKSIAGEALSADYDGYCSCPLTTSLDKVLMAEFTYGGKVTPTLPLAPNKEYKSYWWVKTTGLPMLYWDYMLKGREAFFPHNVNFVEEQ